MNRVVKFINRVVILWLSSPHYFDLIFELRIITNQIEFVRKNETVTIE